MTRPTDRLPGWGRAVVEILRDTYISWRDARTIRLGFPPLTEERRKELVRVVSGMAEDAKRQVRNIRREDSLQFG